MKTHTCMVLPDQPNNDTVYYLTPNNFDPLFYKERTDRNLGWLTEKEQNSLRHLTVGIAGCGGMGGLLVSILIRLGVGEVRFADSEVFDVSNINRQYAASRQTVGLSKAFETARMARAVSDDTTLVIYPQGIQEDTVESFVTGCDIICDEIEFWAVGSRLLLHRISRREKISVFNCNTVGFGTRLFFFEPHGFTMEELLGMSYEEGKFLQAKIVSEQDEDAVNKVMQSILKGLVPELPEYSKNPQTWSTVANINDRLWDEGRASIVATNPPMATGFLADHLLFYFLHTRGEMERNLSAPVPAPGYLLFDAALHTAKRVERKEPL